MKLKDARWSAEPTLRQQAETEQFSKDHALTDDIKQVSE